MSYADHWAALCRETDKLARLGDPRIVVTRAPECVRVSIDLDGDEHSTAQVEQPCSTAALMWLSATRSPSERSTARLRMRCRATSSAGCQMSLSVKAPRRTRVQARARTAAEMALSSYPRSCASPVKKTPRVSASARSGSIPR